MVLGVRRTVGMAMRSSEFSEARIGPLREQVFRKFVCRKFVRRIEPRAAASIRIMVHACPYVKYGMQGYLPLHAVAFWQRFMFNCVMYRVYPGRALQLYSSTAVMPIGAGPRNGLITMVIMMVMLMTKLSIMLY